jgi:hypothetical protein
MLPVTLSSADRTVEAVFREYPHESLPSLPMLTLGSDALACLLGQLAQIR